MLVVSEVFGTTHLALCFRVNSSSRTNSGGDGTLMIYVSTCREENDLHGDGSSRQVTSLSLYRTSGVYTVVGTKLHPGCAFYQGLLLAAVREQH